MNITSYNNLGKINKTEIEILNLAKSMGSGCTICIACEDTKLQKTCSFNPRTKIFNCYHLRFNEYCDNEKAQKSAKVL